MKILELRFKNLNSLYGEWIIDFTDPEYTSNGIFALTGPTGAGKSTILDALCLALYGATPRLGKITKSGNEIMSRQTGECYAEVLFQSRDGQFRCHWEQRRARKKPDGNLQDQEHQISDETTGKPIETKKSLVGKVIEEKTGMDFDRFTRSILLAQGGFDTFLKADIEQKSKILEQITGTKIYTEISCRVHERNRDEKEKLKILHAETSGINILDSQQEKEIIESIKKNEEHKANLKKHIEETLKSITWLTAIENLEKEIKEINEDSQNLKNQLEIFKPQRQKLELAKKAFSIEGEYASITAMRKQQFDENTQLKNKELKLPEIQNHAKKQEQELLSSQKQTIKTKTELNNQAPIIKEVRLLDQKLLDLKNNILELKDICSENNEKIKSNETSLEKTKSEQNSSKKEIEKVKNYLNENKQDQWLISGLTGIKEQFLNIESKQNDILKTQEEINDSDLKRKKAAKELAEIQDKFSSNEKKLNKTVKDIKKEKEKLTEILDGKLLREYRTEKENLFREKAYIKKIQDLEDHRLRLEDGKACPLCGSKEHPFAKGNIPVTDEIDQKIQQLEKLILKAESQESLIEKLEQTEKNETRNLNETEKLKSISEHNKKSAEDKHKELKNLLKKLQQEINTQRIQIAENLKPLGISDFENSQISSILKSLNSKLEKWQKNTAEEAELEKKITFYESEIKHFNSVINTENNTLKLNKKKLHELETSNNQGKEKRKNLYGDKNPDKEETALNKQISEFEKKEKSARDKNDEIKEKLLTLKTEIESLKKSIDQRIPALNQAESEFLLSLKSAEFEDEKDFIGARLSSEEQAILSGKAEKLDNLKIELFARLKDRQTKLDQEKSKKVTENKKDELEIRLNDFQDSLKEILDLTAGQKHKINENEALKEKIKEKLSHIEAQNKECEKWEKLHFLIGSADGKKYRNFAQGLTFELMVKHANIQLQKMTDRYLLMRDTNQPLELNVVDNYQAGEIRSTRNLSGGESFIVSLTLALGLSKMASRKVSVDSLFLDEGFGTLDEETLETALETLSGLQHGGKLIGIISHVSGLKERISTQLNISPVSGGKSSLTGPGCKNVCLK